MTQGRKALNVIAFLGALAGAPGALAQDAGTVSEVGRVSAGSAGVECWF